jgi:hypothetical protein
MNPMHDKLYRNWQATELSREIVRETRILSALQMQQADPVSPTPPARFKIQQWIVSMSAGVRGTARHVSASASRPAGS